MKSFSLFLILLIVTSSSLYAQNNITITLPNGGENWQTGTTHNINWTDNIPDMVKIELYKGGSLNSVIVDSTFSDGQFPWDIPLNLTPGIDYKVKITSLGDSSITDFSDNNFTVSAQSIIVSSPNGGENWQAGTRHNINWTDNIPDMVKIELYKGGSFNSVIVDSTFSDGQFPWDIPLNLTPGTDYKVKITSLGNSAVNDFSDNNFSVYNQSIVVSSPNGGENWQAGTTHSITWTDNISDLVRIELYKGGSLNSVIVDSTFSDGQFPWDIPLNLTPGTDYKVKITSLGNSAVNDFSDNNFSVYNQSIVVSSPNGGENWQAGTTHSITWTDNIPDMVKIELYKAGSLNSVIVDSTFSDGQFPWDIPLNLTPGTDYKVKITSVANSSVNDFSDNDFSVYDQGITITSPNGGENWQAGTTHSITWTDNISDLVRIELYKGGSFNSVIVDSTFSDGQFPWDIPLNLTPGTDYKVKITSVANSSVNDFSDNDFSVYDQGITITSPNGGENWQAGTTQSITWTDNIPDMVKIELYKAGSLNSVIVDSTFSDGQFPWDIPLNLTPGIDYKVKITSLGNSAVNDFSDNNFSVYNQSIVVSSPNGGENWQAGTTHSITWTDNIPDMVKIELYKAGSLNSVIVDSTFSDGQFPWDIPLNLTPGTDYKVKITSVANSSVNDFSDNDFSVYDQGITITSPNGGENWQAGTTHSITWTDNIPDMVKIELYKAGSLNSVIVDSTFSDGQFPWDIPLNLTPGTDYKVKITSVANSSVNDFSDNDFSVYDQGITITSPNGGENWQAGTTQSITWTDNIPDMVKIELYKGGSLNSVIVDSTFSDGQFPWDIPLNLTPGIDYKVKITSLGNSAVNDFSDNNFSVYNQSIVVSSPNGGENWQAGTTHSITWTDNIPDMVKIELYKAGSLNSVIVDSTFSDGQFPWDIPLNLTPGTDYKVKITSVANSSVNDFSDNDFSVYDQGITITSPNGGENWQAGTTHSITWTDNIP